MKRITKWTPYPKHCFSPRWGHTTNLINDAIYIYGGYADKYLSSLYKISLSNHLLTEKLPPAFKPKYLDLKRSLHSSITYHNKIIYYGGMNDAIQNSTTLPDEVYYPYSFDVETRKWELLRTKNTPKKLRTYHSAGLINQRYMFVYGGENVLAQREDVLPSLILDLYTNEWKELAVYENNSDIKDNAILNRKFHSSCVVNNSVVYIYGGYRVDYEGLNEMLIIPFESSSFTSLKVHCTRLIFNSYDITSCYCPFPRWGASLTAYKNDTLILFGGRNKYDLNDLWYFNIKTYKWTQIESYTEIPSPRRKHTAFIYKDIFFILGGYQGSYLNDIHFVNLNDITVYHQKDDLVMSYINNELHHDFVIKTKHGDIPCHKTFFLSRIALSDFPFSPKLSALSKKENSHIIDITSLDVSRNAIMAFLSLLYLGYFPSYINRSILIDIIKIMIHLSLQSTARRLFYCVVMLSLQYKYRKVSTNGMIDTIKTLYPTDSYPFDVFYYDSANEILKVNKLSLTKKLNVIYNRVIYVMYPDRKKVVPCKVQEIFNEYIKRGDIDIVVKAENEIEAICLLIETLYYADYFSFSALCNKIELQVINLMRDNRMFSMGFLFYVMLSSFLSNGDLLFNYIFDKLRKEHALSTLTKMLSALRTYVHPNADIRDVISFISSKWKSNALYDSLSKERSEKEVMDFALTFNSGELKERKELHHLTSSLKESKLRLRVPMFKYK